MRDDGVTVSVTGDRHGISRINRRILRERNHFANPSARSQSRNRSFVNITEF